MTTPVPDYTVSGYRTHQRLNPEDLRCVHCGAIMSTGECKGNNHRVYWEAWFLNITDIAEALHYLRELEEVAIEYERQMWADAHAQGVI